MRSKPLALKAIIYQKRGGLHAHVFYTVHLLVAEIVNFPKEKSLQTSSMVL